MLVKYVRYVSGKFTYRNMSVCTYRKSLFLGKGCPLKVSYICFDELPWRFSVLGFQKRQLNKALQSLTVCKVCYLYWKKTECTNQCYTRHSLDYNTKKYRKTDISDLMFSFTKTKNEQKNCRATPAEFSCYINCHSSEGA